MTDKAMSDDHMVHLVRNALLVAGHDMGPVGDHWPAITATIHEIMKNWEDVQIERNVFAEVKKHYESMISELIAIRNTADKEAHGEMDKTIDEVRSIYRACFDESVDEQSDINATDVPPHLLRAAAILGTLEEAHE